MFHILYLFVIYLRTISRTILAFAWKYWDTHESSPVRLVGMTEMRTGHFQI
jgi:hypothetical protein